MRYEAAIVAMGGVCPVGLDMRQSAASLRARVGRKLESNFLVDRWFEPIVVGHLPDQVLPALGESIGDRVEPWTLQSRFLQLAAPALQDACHDDIDTTDVPIFLAAPRQLGSRDSLIGPEFFELLQKQSGVPFAADKSSVVASGRAGLFAALRTAIEGCLARRVAEFVYVGGVDTYVDQERITRLDHAERLAFPDVFDGFTPGEGAAFSLLCTKDTCKRRNLEPLAYVSAVGEGREEGHRYSEKPYLGEGLSAAIADAGSQLTGTGETAPASLVVCGLNGESFNAKEWGVAMLRNRELFSDELQIEHPAQYTGDMGAAMAPLMLGVAATWLNQGQAQSPVLLWSSSDHEERGAAFVTVAQT